MGRPPGPTKYTRERKAKILEEVERMLVDGSFRETTMDAIGERTGIAKSTLYHYFPRKDDLLYELFDETLSTLISAARRRLELDMSASQRLYESMCDLMELTARSPGRARVLYEHKRSLDDERHETLTALEREYFTLICDSVRDATSAGDLRPIDPALAAHAVIGMVSHSRYWYDPEGGLSPREIAFTFWKLFVDGAALNPGSAASVHGGSR